MTQPQPQQYTWSAGAASQRGRRDENQDRMTRFSSPFGEVIAVADGMGGMQGGATAAETVVRQLPVCLNRLAPATAPIEALQTAVNQVNDEIFRLGHSGNPAIANMGTTVVLALIRDTTAGKDALVANIGDSRAYLFREGVLHQLTKDHTAVQRLVDAGALSSADARKHPEASILSRAMGQQTGVKLEFYPPLRLLPGDGLLLCSDGLSGFVDNEGIAAELRRSPDPSAAVRALGELALQTGSDDNITIQYLRLSAPVSTGAWVSPQPPKAKRRSRSKLAAIALTSVLVMAAAVGGYRLTRPPQIIITDGQVAKNSGNKPLPTANSPKPPKIPDEKAPERGVVQVYFAGVRPEWLAQLKALPCVDYRPEQYRPGTAPFHLARKKEIRLLYRPGKVALGRCLQEQVPELKGVKPVEDRKLPEGVDAMLLLPRDEPKEAEAADVSPNLAHPKSMLARTFFAQLADGFPLPDMYR